MFRLFNMRFVICLLVSVLCFQYSSAQTPACTCVIIDTVTEMKGSNPDMFPIFQAEYREAKSSYRKSVDIERTYFESSDDGVEQYGVQFKVCSENVEAVNIGLSMDNKSGMIWFMGVPNNGDTLHIPNWTIRKNCFRDSIFTSTEYFKIVERELQFVKAKLSNNLSARIKCSGEVDDQYCFLVNGKKIDLILSTKDHQLVTTGHGYWGRKKRRVEPDKYFHFQSVTIQKSFYGEVDFSKQ